MKRLICSFCVFSFAIPLSFAVSQEEEEPESRRFQKLFRDLCVEPQELDSSHPADLPELYRPDPRHPGVFIVQPGVLDIGYDATLLPNSEMIRFKYVAAGSRYYVEYRADRRVPHVVYGPYDGNPFVILPRLERHVVKDLKADMPRHNTRLLNNMLQIGDEELTGRAMKLIQFGLETDLNARRKVQTVLSIEKLVDRHAGLLEQERFADKYVGLRKLLDERLQNIEDMRVAIPLEEYQTADELELKNPKTIPDENWGEPVKGLRFAAVPNKTSAALNDNIYVSLVLENVGDADLIFSLRDVVQDIQPRFKCDNRHVQIHYAWFSGWPPLNRYILKPGERITVGRQTIRGVPDPPLKRENPGFGTTVIFVPEEA